MIKDHYDMIRNKKISFWWFRGRKDLFFNLLSRDHDHPSELGLDAGCGPLTNESLYAGFARRWIAFDHSSESFKDSVFSKDIQPVIGDIQALPLRADSVDLVLLLDVLEHIENEKAVLSELKRVLKNGGLLLISVPAFECLWSFHDEQAAHKRRYRGAELKKMSEAVGFETIDTVYFNSFMFFPIYLIRKVLRILPGGKNRLEMDLSPGFLDPILYLILRFEYFINFFLFKLPFGTSFVILLRKNND